MDDAEDECPRWEIPKAFCAHCRATPGTGLSVRGLEALIVAEHRKERRGGYAQISKVTAADFMRDDQ